MASDFFAEIREALPKSTCYFKAGNHEDRLNRALCNGKTPALKALRCLELKELLGLKKSRFKYYGVNDPLVLNDKLVVTHGSLVRGASGASGLAELGKRGRSGISGHVHRLAHVWDTKMGGTNFWVEAGFLGRMDGFDFLGDALGNWQQGCVIGYQWTKGREEHFNLMTIPINNGVAIFEGTMYV